MNAICTGPHDPVVPNPVPATNLLTDLLTGETRPVCDDHAHIARLIGVGIRIEAIGDDVGACRSRLAG